MQTDDPLIATDMVKLSRGWAPVRMIVDAPKRALAPLEQPKPTAPGAEGAVSLDIEKLRLQVRLEP